MPDAKTTQDAGGDQQETAETVETLTEKLGALSQQVTDLTAEATKNKALRKKAEKERDDAKKASKPTEDGESDDYKTLWKESETKVNKIMARAKKADIDVALTEQFGTAKVAKDRYGAALKLIDHSMIEWNEDSGVDADSVVAAVQKLNKEHKFLFETAVAATNPKKPGSQGNNTGKTISRTDFFALSPADRLAQSKAGTKVVDDE